MDGANGEQDDEYNQTFIDSPAILDKYKAAAEVAESKYKSKMPICHKSLPFISIELWVTLIKYLEFNYY